MNWEHHAATLAERVTDPDSRWRAAVASTPRHTLIPNWWEQGPNGWTLHRGEDDPKRWARMAYGAESAVTSVGGHHADHGKPDQHPTGLPTSSATLAALVVKMLRHGRIGPEHDVLDVGTGAGGLTAYLSHRIGDRRVTSVDVDPYLVDVARERLAALGLNPRFAAVDATGPLPGDFDRIVSTVGVRPVPASWLAALRKGGRLVTTIRDTALILTAWGAPDGGAVGHIERDWAGFMGTRHGANYPPGPVELFKTARESDGEVVTTGRYPVADVRDGWEVWSFLSVSVPGIEYDYEERDGLRTAFMVHPDGSWARASATGFGPPTVHQGGPRRLWAELERIRTRSMVEGGLPLYGCDATVTPDGVMHLSRGRWSATVD
ncbi:methyltransferase domain-containing protein [Streptomyces sp. CB01881]|uniref:methyltransferase domain-containing protein n=1 Tax=Streptomyces sp. CB01881 TaxID=2078691 RepID=UPI000CDBE847|nr:methyltransferase domain-containing protein [Streptomyces sp. CB01881]AUY52312.1 protein-L-isoaspartate(D-aspartate) O-methyltransferase [Streptomyces sp. CB01881]TYC71733.1 methyltransferase domain-containing protein [Streptomyces sp. CB01881]